MLYWGWLELCVMTTAECHDQGRTPAALEIRIALAPGVSGPQASKGPLRLTRRPPVRWPTILTTFPSQATRTLAEEPVSWPMQQCFLPSPKAPLSQGSAAHRRHVVIPACATGER